eukprot:TRINITY_DN28215_c0_g1_i2.p1 TRINITY_DN28215_c0_g1~~TRINITY_DN28215_c0_g1_i2.p1  ORF type:complete len:353 (-),score=15.05 TRINITY_DN28215_c0_g1_i2:139-1197(-)
MSPLALNPHFPVLRHNPELSSRVLQILALQDQVLSQLLLIFHQTFFLPFIFLRNVLIFLGANKMLNNDKNLFSVSKNKQLAFAPRICNTGALVRIERPNSNSVHLDWLEFCLKDYRVFLGLIGLSEKKFKKIETGLHGYGSHLRMDGISILYDEYRQEKGQKIIINGSGFDQIPHNDTEILDRVAEIDGVVQRIDVCLNVFDGEFSKEDVEQAILSGGCVTTFKKARPVHEFDLETLEYTPGKTWYLGSPSGLRKVRIYDKKVDFEKKNKTKLDFEWIRFELEARKKAGQALFWALVSRPEGINGIIGIIRSVCDFREVLPNNAHKPDWPLLSWWEDAIKNASAIRLSLIHI